MSKPIAVLLISASLLSASTIASARPYSDSALAQNDQLSPFDRVYEAGRAQSVNQPADYLKSQSNPAAVLDLSRDEPLSTIEETSTERTYRSTIQELEQSKSQLQMAREQAQQKLQEAQQKAELAERERLNNLSKQEEELRQALALNQRAKQEVALAKTAQLADIHAIKSESDRLLMLAEANAEVIETQAKKRITLERIDPSVVLNESAPVEFQGATLEEIVRGIMPAGWRVRTDFANKPELQTRRYEFVSTDARDVALRKLTSSIQDARVRFQYFWDLTDSAGNPSPMILLTDRPN